MAYDAYTFQNDPMQVPLKVNQVLTVITAQKGLVNSK